MRSLSRSIIGLAVVLTVGASLGCNSPTLPLPPPSQGQIQMVREGGGNVKVSGLEQSVEPYALVTCFNNSTGKGVVGMATGNGTFVLDVPAAPGDVIEIWQRVYNDPPSIVMTVK